MTFKSDCIEAFKKLLSAKQDAIRNFPGCQSLEIVQGANDPQIFFTISTWDDETDLNNYRNSDLFKGTWEETKKMFDNRPFAWTTKQLHLA